MSEHTPGPWEVSTQIPGTKAQHAYVTDTCRENRTDPGAVDEALARLREEAVAIIGQWPRGSGMRLHFVLTMERPLAPPVQP